MTKFLKPDDDQSKGEWIWIVILRILAGLYIVSILWLPFITRFSYETKNVEVSITDIFWVLGCAVMFGSPGKTIGGFLNEIGKKLTGKF